MIECDRIENDFLPYSRNQDDLKLRFLLLKMIRSKLLR